MIEPLTIVDNRVAARLKSDVKAVLLCKIIEQCRYSKLYDFLSIQGKHWISITLEEFKNFIPYKNITAIEGALIDLEELNLVITCYHDEQFAYRPNWAEIAREFPHLILDSDHVAYESHTEKHLKDKVKSKRQARKKENFKYDPQDLQLAKAWIENALQHPHDSEKAKKWNPEQFAAGIYKARHSVKLGHDEMKQVFIFMCDDDFWQNKCLVPKFLLNKGRNGNTKIANLVAAWQQSLRAKSKGFSYLRENFDTMGNVIDTTSTTCKQEEDIDLFG